MRDAVSFGGSGKGRAPQNPWWRDGLIALVAGIGLMGLWFGGEYALKQWQRAKVASAGAPLMWVLKDADSTIYLFGSFHALKSGTQWSDVRLFQAFDTADEVYFEVADVDALSPALRRGMTNRRGNWLTALTPEEREQLDAFARGHDFDLQALTQLKPWVVAFMVEGQQMHMSGFRSERGVDNMLQSRAEMLGLPVKGMETPEAQLAYFLTLDEASSRAYLKSSLKSYGNQIHHLADAWSVGDEATLTAIIEAEKRADPAMHEGVLTRRNTAWVRKIEKMMAGKGHIFITVGAGHLVGSDSVVAQLRARGFEVQKVEP